MFDSIRSYVEAKRNAPDDSMPSVEIIGDRKSVYEFAHFYREHKKQLEILQAALLVDIVNNAQFDSDNFNSYRLGVNYALSFFKQCDDDIEHEKLANKEKKDLQNNS